MITRTINQVAQMAGGKLIEGVGETRIHGVTTDSRSVQHGQLFVPLCGERFDGHDYAAAARTQGAAAALWQADRPVPEELAGWPLVLVADTLHALQQLAAAYRRQLNVKVIGITGSNGKTTTKDMVAAVLAAVFRVHKTKGNLNNHIGLPLTLLEMAADTQALVAEMGMSGLGEIEQLSRIAAPDVAIITTIGEAHLLQLGSRANIARAKLEIVSGLPTGGLLIYNGDEPLLTERVGGLAARGQLRLSSFGQSAGCDWTVEKVHNEASGARFELVQNVDGKQVRSAYQIPVPGLHNVLNGAAAIAAATALGVPQAATGEALAHFKLSAMRVETVRAFNGATILNDAYNANPTAMRAALSTVASLQGFRRRWLVLGDMLELGPEEQELHYAFGASITTEQAEALLTCGTLARFIHEGARANLTAPESAVHFTDKQTLALWLRSRLHPEDLVLVKGSRGMRMEQIVQELAVKEGE